MRELNVAEIPPTRETGRCELVQTVIAKGLTDWRHHVKVTVRPDEAAIALSFDAHFLDQKVSCRHRK